MRLWRRMERNKQETGKEWREEMANGELLRKISDKKKSVGVIRRTKAVPFVTSGLFTESNSRMEDFRAGGREGIIFVQNLLRRWG